MPPTTDNEIITQVTLGSADINWLRASFILRQNNPKVLAALAKLWETTTALSPTDQIYIADILVSHPHIPEHSRKTVLQLRNNLVRIREIVMQNLRKLPND